MKIAVLVKEVPDMEALVKVADGGAGVEVEKKRSLNFFDEIAVEGALRLKSAGDSINAVSAGAGVGLDALRRALAMGVDGAFHIDDPALEFADPLTVAKALAALLKREGFDLVLAGKQATDDEAGTTGPMVAELLGIPAVSGAVKIALQDGKASVTRETDSGAESLSVPLPCLISAEKGLYEPRVPQVMGLMKAMKAVVPKVSLADLGVDGSSQLKPVSYSGPRARPPVKMIDAEPGLAVEKLVLLLKDEAKVI